MASIKIEGLDVLLKKLEGLPDGLKKGVDIELKDGSEAVAERAKLDAPGNTGSLRQGIGSAADGDLTYQVYSNADYSAYVEFGTGAKVQIPPGLEEYAAQFKGSGFSGGLSAKDAIYHWCQQKGIPKEAWYPIFVSIMTNGVRAQPFFFPALASEQPKILKNVGDAIQEAIDK